MSVKPVFFSDLDRTLIFSKKFLSGNLDSIAVEQKEGKSISYMTRKALSLLQEVRKESLFIPVSTRTWETMTRIDFIQEDLPEWMICDNGAHIYLNGVKLEKWEAYIEDKRKAQLLSVAELERAIQYVFEDKGLKAIFNRENIYLMVKFEEMTAEIRQILEVLSYPLKKKGFRMDINSRKAYLLPDYVRKEDAVAFLIKEYDIPFTISAGDTFMDLDMLRKTTYAIAPKHKSFPHDFMKITHQKGMMAGEELLHYIQYLCRYCK